MPPLFEILPRRALRSARPSLCSTRYSCWMGVQTQEGHGMTRTARWFYSASSRGISHSPTSTSSPLPSNTHSDPLSSIPNPIPCAFLRGGTSKGIYINDKYLQHLHPQTLTSSLLSSSECNQGSSYPPATSCLTSSLTPLFLSLMGSPDAEHSRQLNGMGGGITSLSKIMIVGRLGEKGRRVVESMRRGGGVDDVQIEYTFVQVGIKEAKVDYSGNCGNLSAMVGVFAVDEGLVDVCGINLDSTITIKAFNTNTSKIISTRFPVDARSGKGQLGLPETEMAGVPGKGSIIDLEFDDPGGARTGMLVPSGRVVDVVRVEVGGEIHEIRVSLIDATNPTVFVLRSELEGLGLSMSVYDEVGKKEIGRVLELIRKEGARMMGLDVNADAQPKIAVLGEAEEEEDVIIQALSMRELHKTVPMTVGLCLGVAAGVRGSLAWEVVQKSRRLRVGIKDGIIKMRHKGGIIDVKACFEDNRVKSVGVVRTGRRLMTGEAWW